MSTQTAQSKVVEHNTKHSRLGRRGSGWAVPVRKQGQRVLQWKLYSRGVKSKACTSQAGCGNELNRPGQEDALQDGKDFEELEDAAWGQGKETTSSGCLVNTQKRGLHVGRSSNFSADTRNLIFYVEAPKL